MRARRVDRNHAELRKDCAKLGISWLPIAPDGERGRPDALLGWLGEDRLVEVKPPLGPKGGKSGRELRTEQAEWHASWHGRPVSVVRTIHDIVALFRVDILGEK